MSKIDQYADENPDLQLVKMDGYDDCCIGVVQDFFGKTALCYDREKVIKKLVKQGMSREEAEEWHYFNQAGAYVGEATPVFVDRI